MIRLDIKCLRKVTLLIVLLLIAYVGIDRSITIGIKSDVYLQGLVYQTKYPIFELKEKIYNYMVADSASYDEFTKRQNNMQIQYGENNTPLFSEILIELDGDDNNKFIYKIGLYRDSVRSNSEIIIKNINKTYPKDLNSGELRKGKRLLENVLFKSLDLDCPINQQPNLFELLTIEAIKDMFKRFEYNSDNNS